MSNTFPTFSNLRQIAPWTLSAEDANLFGETMANQGNIANEILRQLHALSDKVDSVENRCVDKVDEVINQLGGPDGVRERLTALEVRMEQVAENTPAVSYPPPEKYRQKKSAVKEHGGAIAGTAGVMTVVYTIIEIVSAVIQHKQ